jgi:hypothetical protein
MFNLISILFGFVALMIALAGLMPLLGWINWMALPFAVIGAAFGVLSSHRSGLNLNILVLIVCVVRLFMGGGFF